MAFFKFRLPGQSAAPRRGREAAAAVQAESVDALRRRARHRLIGATVLVLAAVIGFPLLFDTQPRPVPVNVAMDIPDRHKVAPLVVPQQEANTPRAAEPATSGLDAGEEVVASRPRSAPAASQPAARVEPKVPAKAETPAESKPEPKPEPKPAPKAEAKPESKPEPRPDPKPARQDDAARARALLEGRNPQPSAAPVAAREEQGRFIVQVGAFADADKAREVRDRLERSGLKTYTQVVDTKDGKRTRVRVGPFTSRADADKAAGRVKGAGLSASVLAL